MRTRRVTLASKFILELYSFFLTLGSAVTCLFAASQPARNLFREELESFDLEISSWIRANPTRNKDRLMRLASSLGENVVFSLIALLAGGALFLAGARWEALAICTVAFVSAAAVGIMKLVFSRPRPDGDCQVRTFGTSFPSGHANSCTAFYLLLAFVLYQFVPPQLRWLLMAFTLAVVLLVGLSRVYLGAHYATDVLAGFATGGTIALLTGLAFGLYRLPLAHWFSALIP
ncbi:MAG: phosphatase PAP2 family protein [Coprothermobacterota bacterium]|nr:phosphatase PAP2 family protein [Coprothermobacterota bacterium]